MGQIFGDAVDFEILGDGAMSAIEASENPGVACCDGTVEQWIGAIDPLV